MAGGNQQHLLQTAVRSILPENLLELRNINLTPDHCSAISQVLHVAEHISDVILDNCRLKAEHCHVLASSTAMQRIHAVCIDLNPGIRGEGLCQLVDTLIYSQKLKFFRAWHCKLDSGDGQLLRTLLQHSHSLQFLNIEGNDFGEVGIRSLSEGISSSRSLQCIWLSYNTSSFTSPSSIRHFCTALKENKTLKEVHIVQCSLDDHSAERILQAGYGLDHLDLRLNNLTDNIITSVRSFLAASNSQNSNFSTGEAGIKTGAHQELQPYSVKMANTLSLRQTRRIHVDLSGNQITPKGIKQLRTTLPQPNVHFVMFGYCLLQGSDCKIEPLDCHASHVRTAAQEENDFDDSVSSQPNVHLNYRAQGIGDHGIIAVAYCLRSSCPIGSLDFHRNNITDNGLCDLAKGLANNTTLRALNLDRNKVTVKGVATLMNSLLRSNHHLQLLTLDNNPLFADHSEYCREDYESVIKQFMASSHLQFIGLGGSGLTTAELPWFTSNLQHNSSLLGINLSDNALGDDGARLLSDALRENKTLLLVELNNVAINDEGAQFLAAVLSRPGSREVMIFMGDNPASSDFLVQGMVDGAFWYNSHSEMAELLQILKK